MITYIVSLLSKEPVDTVTGPDPVQCAKFSLYESLEGRSREWCAVLRLMIQDLKDADNLPYQIQYTKGSTVTNTYLYEGEGQGGNSQFREGVRPITSGAITR